MSQSSKKTDQQIVYHPEKKYLASKCIFNDEFFHASRPVAINWEKLHNKIQEFIVQTEPIHLQRYIQKGKVNTKTTFKKKDMDTFWRIMRGYRCCDLDEGHMSPSNISSSPNEARFVLGILSNRLIPKLRKELDKTAICDGLDNDVDYVNLMTHVVAKGEEFYNGILQNPVVSLYLCDQYRPINTWLLSAANLH